MVKKKSLELEPISESILLSLSTYPDFQTDNYLDSLINNLESVGERRKKMFEIEDNSYDNFFKPLVYTLWGFWDLCVLSVADNSEIITKVMQPELDSDYNPEGQITSKLYSGISFKGIGSNVEEIYNISKNDSYPFIGIVNLKLSSKWHLFNNELIVPELFHKINKLLAGFTFFPVHTFNTYEISIIILGDNLKKIFDKIFDIRELKLSQVIKKEDSLTKYNHDLPYNDSHFFTDSQSYYGARLLKETIIKSGESSWKLAKGVKFNKLKAIFEFEARPGHAKDLEKEIDKISKNTDKIMLFQTGQYDFYVSYNYNSTIFFKFFNALRNKNAPIKNHIRKFKTKLLFDHKPKNDLITITDNLFDSNMFFDLKRINESLKKIKVSRSLRNQIIKLFYSYQNSLLNRVTYSAFIDMFYFVKDLQKRIFEYEADIDVFHDVSNNDFNVNSVKTIEQQLGFIVATYKDSYYLRYVNDRISDIQDFLIPHNSQLQTIIGFYDSYVKCILSELTNPELGDSMILTFDEHVTEVNEISIKLLSTNLFEPGLVFTALSKEITTIANVSISRIKLTENINTLKVAIREYFHTHPDNKYNVYEDFLIDFNYEYGVSDYIRYKYFFKSNFDLFAFYHLGFIIQYPKVYDSSGNINLKQVLFEVQRLFILTLIINERDNKDCFDKLNEIYVSPSLNATWRKFMDLVRSFITDYETTVSLEDKLTTTYNFLIQDYTTNIDYKNLQTEGNMASDYIDLSYQFMDNVYKQHNKARGLNRSWKDGSVKKSLLNNKDEINDPYFLFDSQGGAFYINFKNLQAYTKKRNEMFEKLRSLSVVYKSKLYKKILENEQTKGA